MGISAAPGGAAEPQGQVVQGGGQLPSDRGVGQGRAAGKPCQAQACWLPDMLVVAWPAHWSTCEGNNCNWLWCKQTG